MRIELDFYYREIDGMDGFKNAVKMVRRWERSAAKNRRFSGVKIMKVEEDPENHGWISVTFEGDEPALKKLFNARYKVLKRDVANKEYYDSAFRDVVVSETRRKITEGKHWPEDYLKTAFNAVKASDLGKQPWYSDNAIRQDLKTFADEFEPLSHKNSNLGYFMPVVRWFIEFSGKDRGKYQEFVERKLDDIVRTLLYLSNNPSEETKIKDDLKGKWSFADFEKYMAEVEGRISAEQSKKTGKASLADNGYEVVPIDSYEELHEKFGGDRTGYKRESEWCHTNGKSTYDSWTSEGKYMFFVLAKKGWEKIGPPENLDRETSPYDEYGTSLIAILVDVASNKLLNATLRWNHVLNPSRFRDGASVDRAFLGWGDLAEVTGKDVESEVKRLIAGAKERLERASKDNNEKVKDYLEDLIASGNTKIEKNEVFKNATKIKIPNSVESIGNYAFNDCKNLKSIEIPDSVKSIGNYAFNDCKNLKSVEIPDSVESIGDAAFGKCESLESIEIPNSVKSIGDIAFSHCKNLKSIEIPNSVENIGYGAFDSCYNLKSIKIPDSVENIGEYAFDSCYNLKSIEIPDSVESIGDGAFSYCESLESIKIPDSVESIGYDAFVNCKKLKTIYCSEKTFNKFKDRFTKDAVRKDIS